MTEWPSRTLGEIVDEGRGFIRTGPFGSQLHRSDYVEDPDGIPVVMPKDMANGRLDGSTIARVDRETADRLSQHLFEEGDIALSRRGDVGRSAWIGPDDLPALCGTGAIRVHLGQPISVHSDYLRYFLRSRLAIDYLEGKAVGATMPNLNAGIVTGMPVPILPLKLQVAAAAVLRSIDDLIETNRRRVEVLEEIARAIYREWFVHFRYPGHESVPLVDSSLGPIPQGWEVRRLDDLAAVNRSSRRPKEEETIKYLDISSLGDRKVDRPTEIAGHSAPGRARRVVTAGDVVWSMVRPNRRAHALLIDPGPDWLASTGLAVLSPTKVSSSLLFETVSHRSFSDHLVGQATGAAYPAVKPKDFQAAPVLLPAPAIDRAFEQVTAPLHQCTWKLWEVSIRLATLRDSLLPKLVTGQIDVSSLDLASLVEGPVT